MGGEAYAFKLRKFASNSVQDMLLNAGMEMDDGIQWRVDESSLSKQPTIPYRNDNTSLHISSGLLVFGLLAHKGNNSTVDLHDGVLDHEQWLTHVLTWTENCGCSCLLENTPPLFYKGTDWI
jgi:hypothetical protein